MPAMATTSAAAEMPSHVLRRFISCGSLRSSQRRTLPWWLRPLMAGRRATGLLDTARSHRTRATISAETIEAMTPMDSVTPKPLIGPDPRKNSRPAASRVVTLESMIALHALLKPTESARLSPAEG